jgi:hypothetical protein
MQVAALLLVISSIGTGFTFAAWEFAVWRILSKVAIGMASAWQWMFLSCAIPAAVYLYLAMRIPESPRYLMQRNRIDQSRGVLGRVLPAGEVDP